MSRILITGGTGLIGNALSGKLKERGYQLSVLSRSGFNEQGNRVYQWDPARNEIDEEALEDVECIVHLAGVNIGGGRWTTRRKERILKSRVGSGQLILDRLAVNRDKLPGVFITASAIGYYGAVTGTHIYTESDPPAEDFLGQTCSEWEAVADRFSELGVRSVKIRTGVVLSETGGILNRLRLPVRFGLGAATGSGKQYLPWIHLEDLCNIYVRAIEDHAMEGAYNAVAPEYITNREFMRNLARAMNRPFWLPHIPSIFMKAIFGEMSSMLLEGSRVSPERIISSGFRYQYPDLEGALKKIYSC